eukprot:scaffold129596_cov33-Tisochrysis_lutea.AAC.3
MALRRRSNETPILHGRCVHEGFRHDLWFRRACRLSSPSLARGLVQRLEWPRDFGRAQGRRLA